MADTYISGGKRVLCNGGELDHCERLLVRCFPLVPQIETFFHLRLLLRAGALWIIPSRLIVGFEVHVLRILGLMWIFTRIDVYACRAQSNPLRYDGLLRSSTAAC